MADVEIEVAVAVEVGKRRRGRPVAVAAQARAGRHVLERAVSLVAIKGIRPPAGDEEVGPAVVVVVADGDSVAVAPAHRGDARPGGHVLERAVAPVAEQPVAVFRGLVWRRERPPLHDVDVEPAVAVEIEQPDAAAHGFRRRWVLGVAMTVVVHKPQAGSLGVIDKSRALSRQGTTRQVPLGPQSRKGDRRRLPPASGPGWMRPPIRPNRAKRLAGSFALADERPAASFHATSQAVCQTFKLFCVSSAIVTLNAASCTAVGQNSARP